MLYSALVYYIEIDEIHGREVVVQNILNVLGF